MLDKGQVNCFEASVQNDVVKCIKRACRTNEPERSQLQRILKKALSEPVVERLPFPT